MSASVDFLDFRAGDSSVFEILGFLPPITPRPLDLFFDFSGGTGRSESEDCGAVDSRVVVALEPILPNPLVCFLCLCGDGD